MELALFLSLLSPSVPVTLASIVFLKHRKASYCGHLWIPSLRTSILHIPSMYLAHSITLSALHANVSFSVKLSLGYSNPVQSNTYSSVLVSSISSSALIRNSQYLANSSTYFALKKKKKKQDSSNKALL